MASVSGILMVKTVPLPCSERISDRTADQLDIGLDHIHADTAPRTRR